MKRVHITVSNSQKKCLDIDSFLQNWKSIKTNIAKQFQNKIIVSSKWLQNQQLGEILFVHICY